MSRFKRFISLLLTLLMLVPCVEAAAVYVSNSSVTNYKTPISEADSELLWSYRMGTSYKNAPSTITVVDGTLLVMSKTTLYKLSAKDGSVIAKAEMADTPSFSYTPPKYADGVIYCPLDNATIQAFDYKTMKSLWIYKDKLGGQSLTPIAYSDGFIYTGFWNEEEEYANYVCIDVTDENKSSTNEKKSATWTYKSLGGFYWAECAFNGNYVIFGTDDGTVYDNKSSKLLCLKKSNGKVADSLSIVGDQRSGITIDGDTAYFVTKAGWLYSVKISKGTFDKSSLKKLSLGGASTSTPVIYGDRVYVNAQGSGTNEGSLKVVDKTKLTLIYSAKTNGYSQNSVLISDAYLNDTGKLYIYTTYNSPPGGLTVYTDSANQQKPSKAELFTPKGDMVGYGISNIVCDENGTLFYKNDSGYIFAIARKTKKTEKPEENKKVFFLVRWFNAIINFFKNLIQK